MQRHPTPTSTPPSCHAFCSTGRPKGSPQLVSAVRGLLTHTFLKGVDVRNEDLVLSSGVTTLLETLFYPLAEAGEGVLIPAPYYPAFDSDLAVRAGGWQLGRGGC